MPPLSQRTASAVVVAFMMLIALPPLSAAQAMRVGVHPLFGAQSVAEMIGFFLVHEGHHLYMIMTRLGDKRSGAPAAP